MLKIKRYLQKNKYFFLFLSVLLLIGLLLGIYIAWQNKSLLQELVYLYAQNIETKTYNYLFFHFFILVISVILSFFVIGIPLFCALLFYEGMSLGFILCLFTLNYNISGLCFALIFLLITKIFYLVCLVFIFTKSLKIASKRIGNYLYKTKNYDLIIKYTKGSAMFIIMVLLYDTALLFLGPKILPLFKFLIT